MNQENFVKLIEEMIDLKIQQHSETNIKASPEVVRLLQEKRNTDRRRLEQIRTELLRIIGA